MKQTIRKVTALLLCMLLTLTLIPVAAYADDSYTVKDSDGKTVEASADTFEFTDGVLYVYESGLVFSGTCSYPMILGEDCNQITFGNFALTTTEDVALQCGDCSRISVKGNLEITAADTGISSDRITISVYNGGVMTVTAPKGIVGSGDSSVSLMGSEMDPGEMLPVYFHCTDAAVEADNCSALGLKFHFSGPLGIRSGYFCCAECMLIADQAESIGAESDTISVISLPEGIVRLYTNCALKGDVEDDDDIILTNGEKTENGYSPVGAMATEDDYMILQHAPALCIYKSWVEDSLDDVEDPVAGTPVEDEKFFDFYVINAEPFENYAFHWLCDAPEGVTFTMKDGSLYLTTTKDAVAGEYPFAITNGLDEDDPDYLIGEEALVILGATIETACDGYIVLGDEDFGWYAEVMDSESENEVVLFSPDTKIGYGTTYTDIFDLEQSYLTYNDEEMKITAASFRRDIDRENGKVEARAQVTAEDGNTYIMTATTKLYAADDIHITLPVPTEGMTVEEWQEGIQVTPAVLELMTGVTLSDDRGLEFDDEFEAGETYHFSLLPFSFGGEPFEFDPEDDYSNLITFADGTTAEYVGDLFSYGLFTPCVSYTLPEGTGYQIMDGAHGRWMLNSDTGLTFRSNADFAKFKAVEVDGAVIAPENYEVREGSTVVTLKADYLNTLCAGKHTLAIVSTDGSAKTTFYVCQENSTNHDYTTQDKVSPSPATGDNSNLPLWIALMTVSAVCLSAMVVLTAKKKKELD
ncbi:MAG: hypothetical protein KBS74_03010 [Clostridiales bacterium]|nr:hypothetical protein [Candidatus Cacconaster stercorequi]